MKILILIMNCNNQQYINHSNVSKEVIKEQISKYNLNEYIDVYDYIGSSSNKKFDITTLIDSTIYTYSYDDVFNSYYKTLDVLEYVNNNIEYDFIFRTNTSTFVNVKLLYEFCNRIAINYKEKIFCADVLSLQRQFCPYEYGLDYRGNGLLLHKSLVNKILDNRFIFHNVNNAAFYIDDNGVINYNVDDICISSVFNIINNNNCDMMYCYGLGFYECGDNYKPYLGNSLCNMNNNNIDFNFLKRFISIQIKSIRPGTYNFIDKFNDLKNIFIDKTYTEHDIEESLSIIDNYSKNPTVQRGYWGNPEFIELNKLKEII